MNEIRKNMIAPCGMNCQLCYANFRDKNKCLGCRSDDINKPSYCFRCIIANCEILKNTTSKFCYECEKFPCKKLKQLDKRYRDKYMMSMIENLKNIEEKGIEWFLTNESKRWTCKECGSLICVHRKICVNCNCERSN